VFGETSCRMSIRLVDILYAYKSLYVKSLKIVMSDHTGGEGPHIFIFVQAAVNCCRDSLATEAGNCFHLSVCDGLLVLY